MFVRILTAGVCLLLAVGCAKKTVKKPAPADETAGTKPPAEWGSPNGKPNAKDTKDGKGASADEPNWLNDPRLKTDPSNALPPDTPPNGKPPGWAGTPPPGGWTAPPPPPATAPGAGAPAPAAPGTVLTPMPMPAAPVAGAATYKPVSEADMKDIWTLVENASGSSGKMPSVLFIYQSLIAAESKAAPLVKDGSIFLTGATTRESIWAFETQALTSGGLAVSQNGVERLSAADLRKRLGK
jgi:hypothetical protein